MNCPKCGSAPSCKNGTNRVKNGVPYTERKQRYKCLPCNYTYAKPILSTDTIKNWGYSEEEHQQALKLYDSGKGLGYRKIAALVSERMAHGTVRNWIKARERAKNDEAS
jgi:transposase-like protein